jgi:hypothetical protein
MLMSQKNGTNGFKSPDTLGSGGSLRVVRDGSAVSSSRESFALSNDFAPSWFKRA